MKTTTELGWSSHPYMWETFLEVLELKSDPFEKPSQETWPSWMQQLSYPHHSWESTRSIQRRHSSAPRQQKIRDKRYQKPALGLPGNFLLGWLKNHSNNWELRGLNMVEPSWLFSPKKIISTCLCTHIHIHVYIYMYWENIMHYYVILVTSMCWPWWCFLFSNLCSVSWCFNLFQPRCGGVGSSNLVWKMKEIPSGNLAVPIAMENGPFKMYFLIGKKIQPATSDYRKCTKICGNAK